MFPVDYDIGSGLVFGCSITTSYTAVKKHKI